MSGPIPPYISYRTFRSFLADLRARGVPARVDRSLMSHKSGTVQSQLLLTLRFLDLITGAGRPTERLRRLLKRDGSEEKAVLREIVETSYGFVFAAPFDVDKATSHQAEDLFKRTGASGETVRRCIAFFLAIARDAGIPVSPYIRPHRKKRAASRRRDLAGELSVTATSASEAAEMREPLRTHESKQVRLRSGGHLTFELAVDVFDLDPQDRAFVFRLIDLLKEYETESERAVEGEPGS